ncbi:2,3-bisphosphoglycerate-independent phosphoglycerate mutase, partial [bacterium]|nr:2,3-bisphosphoglycerate-independent phosphoglycerate mutase [bacterium]
MDLTLKKLPNYDGVTGPLVFVIMDGVGIFKGSKEGYPGNAYEAANPQTLHALIDNEKISTRLQAHGTAVGMPSDADQGNSEVGHNAMGAGRVFDQGASLVAKAIAEKKIYQGEGWKKIIGNALDNKAPIHFIGLLSDGNVHSNIAHLIAMIGECDEKGVEEVYVHALLDGRDVPPLSALRYFGELEDYLWSLRRQAEASGKVRRYFIASGGGRMVTTMDRYEADWTIVERGYNAHVLGEGAKFPNAMEAIRSLRIDSKQDDQYLPAFVVSDHSDPEKPLTTINDGDSVVFFNFRGDRALEISRALTEENFKGFNRKRFPKVVYAGMMEYDGDTHMPPVYLVSPPQIDRTVSEYLSYNKVSQFAISETQKFGHVTYFWNGNNSSKFDDELETWQEIESDKVPFDQAPRMKAIEIAKALVSAIESGKYKFLRCNLANGDMVGHTGSMAAATEAVKAVDEAVAMIYAAVKAKGGTLVLTADHGNCEQMISCNKKTGEPEMGAGGQYKQLTSHTLNPVP